MFQRQTWLISFFGKFHRHLYSRTARCTCISRQNTGTFSTFLLQTLFQLGIKDATRLHMIIRFRPFTVAGELCPTPIRAVFRIFCRSITLYLSGCTLPEQTIRRIPTCSILILSQILKCKIMTVDINHIKQQSARPRINRSAESQRFIRIALHKGIGPGSTISGSKVMNALLRITTLKQSLLSQCMESTTAHSSYFRYRFPGNTVLNRNS